jgi:hypothetical protein
MAHIKGALMIRILLSRACLAGARRLTLLAVRLTEPKLPPYREPEPILDGEGRVLWSPEMCRTADEYWAAELARN